MSPIPWMHYHRNAALKTSNTTYSTRQWISQDPAWDLHCPDPIHNYFRLYTVISLAKELPRCTKIYYLAQLFQIPELFQNDEVKYIYIINIICIYYLHTMQVSMVSTLCAVLDHGTKSRLHWYGWCILSHVHMQKPNPAPYSMQMLQKSLFAKGKDPKPGTLSDL